MAKPTAASAGISRRGVLWTLALVPGLSGTFLAEIAEAQTRSAVAKRPSLKNVEPFKTVLSQVLWSGFVMQPSSCPCARR
jgi:hypothetical protein